MTTEAITIRNDRAQLPVKTFEDLARAGTLLAQSGMFGVANAAAGFVVVATCHQQGISLMEFGRTYHIIDGRPSMRADAMLADLRKAGGSYKIVENSVTRAAALFFFEDQEIPFEYAIEDAKRTGDCFMKDGKTLKHTWQKRPEDMLWARMVSRAVRRLAPEINAGLYPPEEVSDMDGDRQTRASVEISEDEALRRAKVVTSEAVEAAQSVAQEAAPIPDASVCPDGFGDYSGHPWAEMDAETLQAALEADGLGHAHRAAIRLVMGERKEGAA